MNDLREIYKKATNQQKSLRQNGFGEKPLSKPCALKYKLPIKTLVIKKKQGGKTPLKFPSRKTESISKSRVDIKRSDEPFYKFEVNNASHQHLTIRGEIGSLTSIPWYSSTLLTAIDASCTTFSFVPLYACSQLFRLELASSSETCNFLLSILPKTLSELCIICHQGTITLPRMNRMDSLKILFCESFGIEFIIDDFIPPFIESYCIKTIEKKIKTISMEDFPKTLKIFYADFIAVNHWIVKPPLLTVMGIGQLTDEDMSKILDAKWENIRFFVKEPRKNVSFIEALLEKKGIQVIPIIGFYSKNSFEAKQMYLEQIRQKANIFSSFF